MRDPNRIPRLIELLVRTWVRNPDMRLGQMVDNARELSDSLADTFDVEDDDIEVGLNRLWEKGTKP